MPTSSRPQNADGGGDGDGDGDGTSFHVPAPDGEADYVDLDDVGNQTFVHAPPGNVHRLNLSSRWK